MSAPTDDIRTIRVYEPHAEENADQDKLASRLPSLDGKVIGLLDNTKNLADKLLEEVKDLLLKDFPKAEFRYFRKKTVSGVSAELMQQVANCDAVVTAIGD